MVDTIKFSQMTDGGDIDNNKKVPGLKDGANVLFNNPWTFLPPGTTAQRPAPAADMYYRLRFNTEEQLYEYYDAILAAWTQLQESMFTQGPFVIYKADASIPDAQNLGALANGILKQTISLGSATLDIAVNEIDYYGPGMVGYLQAPAGVRDASGNIMLQFQPNLLAVNAVAIENSPTGDDPGFNAIGTDTNVGLGYATKGTGVHNFYSTAIIPMQIHNGTGYQRVNQFRFEDVSGGFTYTFPQASGTISLVGGTADSVQGTANQVLVNGTSGTPQTGALVLTTPQDIATTSSPTFVNLRLNGGGIADGSGNEILHFSGTPMAVNFFALSNVATGNIPVFAATGSDTNVSFGLNTQGAGIFNYKSQALTNQFVLNLGTTYSSVINHNYPSNTNTRTYTWQDASGTVAFLSNIPSVTPAALTATPDTNVTITLGGTPATALLQAASITLGWTGQLSLAKGGTNANLTAANGAIPYSTATAIALLAPGSSGQMFRSGGAGAPSWSTATYPATAGTNGNFLKSDGTNWSSQPISSVFVAPTQQRFTSGSGTYTTPTSPAPLYLRVRMVAGGGGGSESGTAAGTPATAGTNTTFGSAFLVANGGGAAVFGLSGGAGGGVGGSASIASPAYGTALTGGGGSGSGFKTALTINWGGASGAASAFGGQGRGGQQQVAGGAGVANTGGGGGGAGGGNGLASDAAGCGGGAGGFIDAIIPAPSASYAYAVGPGGTGSTAGTNGFAGGNGGSGYIEVTEYYQ